MNEFWKEIPGWEGYYEVSSLGRIRSIQRGSPLRKRLYGGGLVNLFEATDGYLVANLTVHGKRTQMKAHRAVLLAFVGHPHASQEGCHNDGNIHNNSLQNLRWDTRKNNALDSIIHGTSLRGEKNGASKLTINKAKDILKLKNLHSCASVARQFDVSETTIANIWKGKAWKNLS